MLLEVTAENIREGDWLHGRGRVIDVIPDVTTPYGPLVFATTEEMGTWSALPEDKVIVERPLATGDQIAKPL